jgi:hypothetical protein
VAQRRQDEETVLHFEVCVREKERKREREKYRFEVCETKNER